ncbi:hypothetical protein G3I43_03720 [Streptomyces anulatus]|uniref:Uncharacterized protein n=1 Tax=Streptomyces anulatus TaxID=1892 RepID=A0A6G3SKU8_STRAQ|nr:RNase A-like domain-containing protein [Streptomyces anulatus]NEB83295.1 hypothetical protein [Streptomyces anulatus]
MRTFCSALWGGTAWGQRQHGYQWAQTANSGRGTPRVPTGSQPVLAVVKDTADDIATILREYAEAAVDLNRDVKDELDRAMWKAAKDIIEDLAKPKDLMFEAGVARAHGFGARALEEFKDSKVWLKVDSNGNYDLNLASNEYMANGHTLDKHVGKTDEQLAQRLRDQQPGGPTAAWPHGRRCPVARPPSRTTGAQRN